MKTYDLYSQRLRRSQQTEPDVYQYDSLPAALRGQIELIWDDAVGPYFVPHGHTVRQFTPNNNQGWEVIRDVVCRERGRRSFTDEVNPRLDCIMYLRSKSDIEALLDLIEASFRYIERIIGPMEPWKREQAGIKYAPADAIAELNYRFREAAVGYQFEDGMIVRVDNQLIHAEVVKPALQLLSDPRFKGPQQEFLEAHAAYRSGDHKGCAGMALNAFESTLKAICDIKSWEYKKGARATDLLKVVRANGLLPDYLDTSFDQLAATLASGLPKVANESGRHGQGAQPKETPAYIAAYTLHLAAAKIVLLVEAMNAANP